MTDIRDNGSNLPCWPAETSVFLPFMALDNQREREKITKAGPSEKIFK